MKFIVTIKTITKTPTKAIDKMLDGSESELFSKAYEKIYSGELATCNSSYWFVLNCQCKPSTKSGLI